MNADIPISNLRKAFVEMVSIDAPKAQFNPMDIGLACLTECQNAVACPDSVLPDASVMVLEIIIGMSIWRSSDNKSIANKAAFALRVSKIVSTIIRSAPPSNKADVATLNVSTNWSKLIFLNEGSSTSGLNEHV